MAPAAAPEPTFQKDEKIFCFHHELLYEAKVTEVKPNEDDDKKSGFQYKVHYKGWKNTYVFASFTVSCLLEACCFWFLNNESHVCPLPTLDLEVGHFDITSQQPATCNPILQRSTRTICDSLLRSFVLTYSAGTTGCLRTVSASSLQRAEN